ncbi:LysM peptidoglycan-binding domain-containing protein [Trebonia sp.]|uniref:LysM peptidoglycan-binding domain-containing protein n=1 Tax=Trebonia sp. TaxID=2767075 RepID=UPI003BB10113
MRVWTKSACVVLAWGVLLTLLVAGMSGSVSGAQASMRMASSTTEVTQHVTAAFPAAAKPAAAAARYVVRPGDTLSGIAAALDVRGGWQALYEMNRPVIGADPDVIHPGTVLVLPSRATPARYTIQAGDSLSGIAAALGVRGGWPALYAANRKVIGPDPGVIHPGTVLVLPGRPGHPSRPVTAPSSSRPAGHHQAHPAPPATHAVRPHPVPSARTSAPAPAGMPQWLRIMLLAAGLLIGAAFLAELVLAIARRRRRPAAANVQPEKAQSENAQSENVQPENAMTESAMTESAMPETVSPSPPRSCRRFVLADYDRLVVTHNKADDMVCVLRPPGEDPRAILRVARLVLPEDPYEELAEQLGVPASWPME